MPSCAFRTKVVEHSSNWRSSKSYSRLRWKQRQSKPWRETIEWQCTFYQNKNELLLLVLMAWYSHGPKPHSMHACLSYTVGLWPLDLIARVQILLLHVMYSMSPHWLMSTYLSEIIKTDDLVFWRRTQHLLFLASLLSADHSVAHSHSASKKFTLITSKIAKNIPNQATGVCWIYISIWLLCNGQTEGCN